MRPQGFTVWELAGVLAIVATLAAIAAPDFAQLRARAGVVTSADRLLGTLHFARSRAILGGVPVVVCLSNDGETCATGPAGARGWIVFENTRAEFTPRRDAGEPVLRRHRLERTTQLRASRNAVTFWPTVRAGSTSTFDFCDARAPQARRAVIVSQTGRPRLRLGVPRGASAACLT
jgi:type IV fimbrial biogenesis protein FimT